MYTLMIYSEAGGVTKTTTAVSLAMTAAVKGLDVVLIDLDPRSAATHWIGSVPAEDWQTIDAIIADKSPVGWVEDLAIPTAWNSKLRIVPSSRQLSSREKSTEDQAEIRLSMALQGVVADLVIIDCPNRQGGILTQNALAASDGVIYAARANQDGIDGVSGARESVERFLASRRWIGGDDNLTELGIVVGDMPDTVVPRVATAALTQFEESTAPLLGTVPRRTVVDQSRMTGEWYGGFEKGLVVAEAYRAIFDQVMVGLDNARP
ncbi:ParA family protein [Corynebacterium sp. A21]|uniref:ParA family protein n=1 Tax=Corynebacterium sp. A21 TaxID=3457318 RepID=UPI003FD54959